MKLINTKGITKTKLFRNVKGGFLSVVYIGQLYFSYHDESGIATALGLITNEFIYWHDV